MGTPHLPSPPSDHLSPDEELCDGAIQCIRYFKKGRADRPVIVFVPGGGHLGRIGYGHPGSDPEEFLGAWLGKLGYGFLAVSPPSDYPAFTRFSPEVSMMEWAETIVRVMREALDNAGLPRRCVLCAWSMGGKIAGAFTRAAREHGLVVEAFISLSSKPPLLGLSRPITSAEHLNDKKLWDYADLAIDHWEADVAGLRDAKGDPLISLPIYKRYYLGNHGVQLRGNSDRLINGQLAQSVEAAVDDLRTFAYTDFPLCCVIAPTSPSDVEHALTDPSGWALYTVQSVFRRDLRNVEFESLPDESWQRLRQLVHNLPTRLTRFAAGGHFFFVGRTGAAGTATLIHELLAEVDAFHEGLRRLHLGDPRDVVIE